MSVEPKEPDYPWPPRYWWLRRISIWSIVLLLVLAIIRIVWGWDADRRFQSAIDAIRAKGEPILPEDFELPAVQNEQENFVYHFRLATASWPAGIYSPRDSNLEFQGYLPHPANWYVLSTQAIEANKAAYTHIREARKQKLVDWGPEWIEVLRGDLSKLLTDSLSNVRSLSNLLSDTAEYQHLTGNDEEAMESMLDLFAIAEALDSQPALISHLVAIAIDALGAVSLQLISPGIRLQDEPSTPEIPSAPLIKPAKREQVQAIITLLLDPRHCDGLKAALYSERTLSSLYLVKLTESGILLRPMYKLDAKSALARNDHLFAHADSVSFASMDTSRAKGTQRLAKFASNLALGASLDRAVETHFRARTERVMTAVSLAARLYQIDHNGQWPPNLKALVPQYLPAVPVDPQSPDARPLGYLLANGGKRPVVYSVGENRNLGTPLESTLPSHPEYGWVTKAPFQWRDISRFEAPPTSNPTQDQ